MRQRSCDVPPAIVSPFYSVHLLYYSIRLLYEGILYAYASGHSPGASLLHCALV